MNAIRETANELWKSFRLLARNPVGLLGFVLVVAIVLISFVGPLIVPAQTESSVGEIYQGPSARHPVGTDFQGKDNLILLIHGGKDVVLVALLAGLMSTFIAVLVGSLSAFVGGAVDGFFMWLVDIWLALPHFPLLAVLATMVKLTDAWMLAIVLSVLLWAGLARQVRSQVLSLKKRDYVEAAVALDLGTPHIIFREILPNMMSFIAISLVFAMIQAIYQQTALVFLGLVPFTSANWGVMLSLAWSKGAIYQVDAAWNLLAPVFAIVLFQVALVSLTRSLEEVFNPRLRTGV